MNYNWKINLNNNKMKDTGKMFSLGVKDLVKGGITAALTIIIMGAITMLNGLVAVPAVMPTTRDLVNLLIVGIISFLSYVAKNYLTNSNDQFLKKEPTNDNNAQ